MKKLTFILPVLVAVLFLSCSKDENNNSGTLGSIKYNLKAVNNSGVEGEVTIKENEDGSSTVSIQLNGSTTDVHPAFIYHGNETQNTQVAITLNACTCETSVTEVTTLDSGTKISFDGLMAFNGHVQIHMSDVDPSVVATANIGVNAN